MARNFLLTYSDLERHLLDYSGGAADLKAKQRFRRAIIAAYNTLNTKHNWSFFYNRGRVVTVSAYSTGTVVYDHTGGANERQLTLTDGTWPTWAPFGTIRIGTNFYEVDQYISSTIITLSRTSNPGDDVASTTYAIFRDTYPLPTDFVKADAVMNMNDQRLLEHVHPSQWMQYFRVNYGQAKPVLYTFRPDPNYFGQMAISFSPPPDQAYTHDFIYIRSPRPILVPEYSTGTVSISAASTSVTGSGTSWASNMRGSVIRFYSDSTHVPSDAAGLYPAVLERTIASVDSATGITMDAAADQTLSGVAYSISDPVDIDQAVCRNYILRECEHQFRQIARMDPTEQEVREHDRALMEAKETDRRNIAREQVGPGGYVWDVTKMPITTNG